IAVRQQSLGAFEPPVADIAMRRPADGGLEGPREMKLAQARNRREMIDREIAFEVGFDVVEHTGQPALIEPASYCRSCRLRLSTTNMVLYEPGGETDRQRFRKHATARGLVLQLGGNRIGDFSQQRIMKTAVITQRRDQRWVNLDAEDGRREPV